MRPKSVRAQFAGGRAGNAGAILAIALIAGGCLKSAAFSCAEAADCQRGGESGVCESTGFCSFADSSCADGRRYGELSGPFAGQCVGGTPTPDGPAGVDDAPDANIPPGVFCDAANEPALVACWEFENDLLDGSGDGNTGTSTGASAVTFVAGQTGLAADLTATTHISVADSASLTPTSITIEGWIAPTMLPPSGRMGIIDNDGQYGLFLQTTGLSCTVSVAVTVTVAITPGIFQHVACTHDATTGVARVYVAGIEVGTTAGGGALGGGNSNGSAIGGNSPTGDPLVGRIDQLRVWNVARTAQQICTAAGNATCP